MMSATYIRALGQSATTTAENCRVDDDPDAIPRPYTIQTPHYQR